MTHNLFYNCEAEIGGAIAFSTHKPVLLDNTYINNVGTVYGNNEASYAVTISEITPEEAGRTL